MSLTNAQQNAVVARGNVLVVAGAGTGKTTALVERCLDCLLREASQVSLDEILMVTFTEAAATEMRERIRSRLLEESLREPGEVRWLEQLALLETANIGTLHSFCFQLIRQHFYELELDPQLSVMAEEEALVLADEVLEQILQKHYAGSGDAATAVQQLIQSQGRGWDEPIRRLVVKLHDYSQTLPNPSEWIEGQLTMFAQPDPTIWQQWRLKAVQDWCQERLLALDASAGSNEVAGRCAELLRQLQSASSPQEHAQLLKQIAAADDCPAGKRQLWVDSLKELFAEAAFLGSITCDEAGEPLTEDWNWVRSQMKALLGLAREFTRTFTEAKRELAALDFHDLEQYALRLLWDVPANQPTSVAAEWRQKLRFIFVDEYQDINAAQDHILRALSRDQAAANRFLVGDIKQSIYRFRLANPYIFRSYLDTWGRGQGTVVPLVENFRSREALLHFVNDFFGQIMSADLGGVDYDQETRLRFGAPAQREPLSLKASSGPCVELHLRLKSNNEPAEIQAEAFDAAVPLVELEESDKEAHLVGLRLWELKSKQHPVWDSDRNVFRPVEWRDIGLLLRAPANKAESFAKAFARLNIPLEVARRGFYQSLEISDLVCLLQILDNPLQDIPVLAVLRSPLVGLSLNQLAEIRLSLPKGHFWNAVIRWTETNRSSADEKDSAVNRQRPQGKRNPSRAEPPLARDATRDPQQLLALSYQARSAEDTPLASKLSTFLDRYNHWRQLVRQLSLSRCLERVLEETHYAEWLLTQTQGEQRYANVQRLIGLAERFNQFQRQGLLRFLSFIENQKATETEPEVRAATEVNAVRLMSIHQSKGLEFPVVVLADLAKPFNRADLSADIILDEEYGLCPQVKPPHTGNRYPSLPYWLARRRQARELIGEELRLLYVGMTRARDTLLLSASVSAVRLKKWWSARQTLTLERLRGAQSYADWLGAWFALNCSDDPLSETTGEAHWLRWTIHEKVSPVGPSQAQPGITGSTGLKLDDNPQAWQALEPRLAWTYRWASASRHPAKTSVSALRRQAAVDDEEATHPVERFQRGFSNSPALSRVKTGKGKLSASEIGDIHHTFLQRVALDQTATLSDLQEQAARLQTEGTLTAEQVAALDLEAIAAFWHSELGRKIRAQKEYARRELPFTARFSPNELASLTGDSPDPLLEQEFAVVQGIADLVVSLPQEIWLVDFKTDQVKPSELSDKVKLYRPQLWVYSRALSRTFQRPVSECWLYFLALHKAVAVNIE